MTATRLARAAIAAMVVLARLGGLVLLGFAWLGIALSCLAYWLTPRRSRREVWGW